MTRDKIYVFDEEIEALLLDFESYMRKRRYRTDTIEQYRNYSGMFLAWIKDRGVQAEEVNYEVIKDFIWCLRQGSGTQVQLKDSRSIQNVNRILTAIKHYYDHLNLGINPAADLRLKGERRNLQHYFIDFEELEALYAAYSAYDDRTKRNKAILGLLIYQGVTTRELHRLEEKHIQLREGKVYIMGSRNSKNRTLDLSSTQLLDLQEYILVVRPRMLKAIESGSVKDLPGRKPKQIDPKIYRQLFFSEGGSANIKTSLHHLFRVVQKLNPKVKSGKVIRSAVITNWLKSYDVRMVQYMAGHKFVSSTERYEAFNLDDLESGLENFHPLR